MKHPLPIELIAIEAEGFLMESIMVIINKNKDKLLSPNNTPSRYAQHRIHDSLLSLNCCLMIRKILGKTEVRLGSEYHYIKIGTRYQTSPTY